MSLPVRVLVGCVRSTYSAARIYILNGATGAIEQTIGDIRNAGVADEVLGMAGDRAGNLYAVGIEAPTTRKYHYLGHVLWEANHGAPVHQVAIDASGNVYTIGEAVTDAGVVWDGSLNAGATWISGGSTARAGYYTTRKYNSAGVLQWSADHSYFYQGARGIAVDSTGRVYTIANSFSMAGIVPPLTAYTSAGVVDWRGPTTQEYLNAIAVDASDNVYVGGGGSNPYYLEKYSSAGSVLQQKLPVGGGPSPVVFIGVIGTDIYVRQADGVTTKYDTDLDVVDTYSLGVLTGAVGYAMDSALNQYTALSQSGFSPVYTAQSSSLITESTLWATATPDQSGYQRGRCIAAIDIDTPGLRLPCALGAVTTQGYAAHRPPGLSLSLLLATPSSQWTLTALVEPRQVYRLSLTGGTGTIELPLVSLSCRRAAGAPMTLSLQCPPLPLATVLAIEDRLDGQLLVYRGYQFPTGAEQLALFLRVNLTALQSAVNGVTLSGSITDTPVTTQTRALQYITYRTSSNGLRRVRCAVDTYLAPGDTAVLGGGETFIVGSMTYFVSTTQAFMEVVEAGA